MKQVLKSIVRYLGYDIRSVQKPRYLAFDEDQGRDHALLKSFATRAAQFSGSPDQTLAVRNLYLTGLLRGQPFAERSLIDIGDENTLDVGVWRRAKPGKDMPFIRRADRRDEWFYWASKERIEPKRCKWRVALLGESAARGYLYDPHYNPAAVLQSMLESQLGERNVDVIDLAKSNQTIRELKASVSA